MSLCLLKKRKAYSVIVSSLIFFFFSCTGNEKSTSSIKNNAIKEIKWENASFDIRKGISIGGFLSQTGARLVSHHEFFNKEGINELAGLGFDHIRLPIDELVIFTKTLEWEYGVRELIHQTISWCKEANMRIILDLHILRSHYFNNEQRMTLWTDTEEQARFVTMWKKISEEFKEYPTSLLAYELLNQPVPPHPDAWNTLWERTLNEIRKTEPERVILLASGKYSTPAALKTIKIPDDPNIILCIQFHTPHLLTHYHSPWRKSMRDLDVKINYPGQLVSLKDVDTIKNKENLRVVTYYNGYYDKEVLKSRMQDALDKAKEHTIKIHVSEFGCIDKTDKEIRRRWFKDVVAIFRENDISYSVWGYKFNYGLFENDGQVKDEKLVKILTAD